MDSARTSVLVVEDNQDAADSLARFLRIAVGYDVRVAYDGASGVEWAVADPPDAVVCDLSLPRLHGFGVAQQVAGLVSPRPLLIAVTAFGGIYPEDEVRAAGFDAVLTKPADPSAIGRLITAHVKSARAAGR
jgi:two-component system, chemotaxis family, CheB/CheR fusion protein